MWDKRSHFFRQTISKEVIALPHKDESEVVDCTINPKIGLASRYNHFYPQKRNSILYAAYFNFF
jgi:hypothetical protein